MPASPTEVLGALNPLGPTFGDATTAHAVADVASDTGRRQRRSALVHCLVASWRRGYLRRDDSGATLLLAVIFVFVVSLTLLALIGMSGNDIKNSINLENERSLEYAATGATNAAIQAVRYSYYAFNGTTNKSGDDCLPDGAAFTNPDGDTTSMTLNGVAMYVDCTGTLNTGSQNTRTVTFYACGQASCTSANSVIIATVDFQDYSTSGSYSCTSQEVISSCGTGVVVASWIVQNADT